MLRVTQEWTLAGRLFQMAGAAVRKPRVPDDMIHRVADNRLAEADRKDRYCSLQCFHTVGWVTEGHPACKKLGVGLLVVNDLTGALHNL